MGTNQPVAPRLLKYASPTEAGCWEWTGSRLPAGYWRISINGDMELAHRVSYETYRGPIPKGMVIDHLCRNRPCINPEHLEVVTQQENARRGLRGSLTTACPQGHPYDEMNTYRDPTKRGRRCRKCHAIRSKEFRYSREGVRLRQEKLKHG